VIMFVRNSETRQESESRRSPRGSRRSAAMMTGLSSHRWCGPGQWRRCATTAGPGN